MYTIENIVCADSAVAPWLSIFKNGRFLRNVRGCMGGKSHEIILPPPGTVFEPVPGSCTQVKITALGNPNRKVTLKRGIMTRESERISFSEFAEAAIEKSQQMRKKGERVGKTTPWEARAPVRIAQVGDLLAIYASELEGGSR